MTAEMCLASATTCSGVGLGICRLSVTTCVDTATYAAWAAFGTAGSLADMRNIGTAMHVRIAFFCFCFLLVTKGVLLLDETVRLSRPWPVSSNPPGRRESISRPTSFSSVQFPRENRHAKIGKCETLILPPMCSLVFEEKKGVKMCSRIRSLVMHCTFNRRA